jgi:hypothetical protein
VVAGRTTDAEKVLQVFNPASPLIYDESVPYQTFAGQDGKERWLLPLGYIRWQPNQDPNQLGRFVKRTKDDLESSRKFRYYIGVVAERVEGARGFIRMRKRIKDPAPTVWSDDLVWVEGSLRVDKDVRLFGGKLDFRDNVGDDEGTPLAIRRIERNDQKGKGLQLIIGEKQDGLNRLSIGPLKKDDSLEEKVVVTDAGNVGIGTATPINRLDVGGGTVIGATYSGANNAPANGLLVEGNVGIGTTSPQNKLDVKGGAVIGSNYSGINPAPANGLLVEGIVGIGTANAQQKLTLGSGNILLPNANQGIDGNLHFGGISNNGQTGMRLFGGLVNGNIPAGFIDVRTTDDKDGLRFRVDTDKGGTERMRITADGKVGIGTATPSVALEVNGAVKANEFMLADGSQLTGGGKCFNQILLECASDNIDAYFGPPWGEIPNLNGWIQVPDNSPLLLMIWFVELALKPSWLASKKAKLRFGIDWDNGGGDPIVFRECKFEEFTWSNFALNEFIFDQTAGTHYIKIEWCIKGDLLGNAHGRGCYFSIRV